MKKICSIICLSLTSILGINSANAKVVVITAFTISQTNQYFSPSTANAVCGDSIKWVAGSGQHTTVSKTIPAGAAAWNSPEFPTTVAAFYYVVTTVGTYTYTCHPSAQFPAGHMAAKIIVTCTNGVPSLDNNYFSLAYPIPFSESITIETTDADMIILYNILGNKVKSVSLEYGQTKVEVGTAELTKGIYFYSIIKEGVIVETKKLVRK